MSGSDRSAPEPGQHRRSTIRKRLALICLVAIPVECLAFWVWVEVPGVQGMILAGALHLAHAALPLVVAPRPEKGKDSANAMYYLAGAIALFMPGLGIVGFTAALLGHFLMRSKGLARDFEKHMLLLDESLLIHEQDAIDEFLRNELSTEPVADIVQSDDRELKRGAIKLLRERGGNQAVVLIRRFLHDEDSEVRLYAHTALVRMQEQMTLQVEAAETAAKEGGFEEAVSLASIYHDYAESGLIEEALSKYYMNQACKALAVALEKRPDSTRLKLRLGEMLLLASRYVEAKAYLEEATESPEEALEAHLALCQLHYECRDLASLSRQIRIMRSSGLEPPEDKSMVPLYQFWIMPGIPDPNTGEQQSREEAVA